MIGRSLLNKKILFCLTCVICLMAASTYAADQTATETKQGIVLKTINVNAAKMNARGKVVEISETAIKIERISKENAEIMKFALDNPAKDIVVNDSVRIDYSVKDGKLTASRVTKPGTMNNPVKNGTKHIKEEPASTAK